MCIAPLRLPDRTVKCGQCKECLEAKAKEWSIRLNQELKYSKTGYFLTLTYNEENLPLAVDEETGECNSTFNKKDVQKFLMRLRKENSKHSSTPLRYYCTAEYGGRTGRAHYHMLLFNLSPRITSYDPFAKNRRAQFDPDIARIWKKGQVMTGIVEGGSINYVTNYMLTKNIDVQPGQMKPFTLMSKGIGSKYVDKNKDWHNFHEIYKVNSPRPLEKRPNMPRYYMEKIFTEPMREMFNREKEEEQKLIQEAWYKAAEEHDPLDPIGWIKKQKEIKRNNKKRPDKAKRL